MDGYALKYDDVSRYQKLKIAGMMRAGSTQDISCQGGEAIRIFTGAVLPSGADTIIMQEKVEIHDHHISILPHDIKQGLNVRTQGSEIKVGEVGLQKGTILTPAAIGFLASIGIDEIEVFRKPKIGLLVTGDELIDVGKAMKFGEVYESNSYTVTAFLQNLGLRNITKYRAIDEMNHLVMKLKEALYDNDLVLLTGGISVGEYDLVNQAAQICGIRQIFHKIRQKPGKPLFFGKKDKTIVFGLPGNPTSVLTCLHHYVYPAIHALSGINKHLINFYCKVTNGYKKPSDITHFLKGYYEQNKVTILDGQESYKLKSYAITNCLIELGEGTTDLQEGDMVKIHLI
jgi:molybdopterin molybdotransferase